MGSFGSIMHMTETYSKPRSYSSPTCFSTNQVSHTPELQYIASKPPPLPPRPILIQHVPHHIPHHVPIQISKSIHCMGSASHGMDTETTDTVQSPRTILSTLQENTI